MEIYIILQFLSISFSLSLFALYHASFISIFLFKETKNIKLDRPEKLVHIKQSKQQYDIAPGYHSKDTRCEYFKRGIGEELIKHILLETVCLA